MLVALTAWMIDRNPITLKRSPMGKNGFPRVFCVLSAFLLHMNACRSQDAEERKASLQLQSSKWAMLMVHWKKAEHRVNLFPWSTCRSTSCTWVRFLRLGHIRRLLHTSTYCSKWLERGIFFFFFCLLDSRFYFGSHSLFHESNLMSFPVSSVSTSLVRSYKRSFNGFAARLTESEAKKIAGN